jgi:hypothetical protein
MHNAEHTRQASPSTQRTQPDANATGVYVSRWLAGGNAAFQPLHDRIAPRLQVPIRQSRVWPVLSGRIPVDDVVQDVWTRVAQSVQNRKTFQTSGPGSFFAILNKISACTLTDLATSQYADKRESAQAVLPKVRHGAKRVFDTPLKSWLRGILRPVLAEYIESLPVDWFLRERQRWVLEEQVASPPRLCGRFLWSLLVLNQWRQRHGVKGLAI